MDIFGEIGDNVYCFRYILIIFVIVLLYIKLFLLNVKCKFLFKVLLWFFFILKMLMIMNWILCYWVMLWW